MSLLSLILYTGCKLPYGESAPEALIVASSPDPIPAGSVPVVRRVASRRRRARRTVVVGAVVARRLISMVAEAAVQVTCRHRRRRRCSVLFGKLGMFSSNTCKEMFYLIQNPKPATT